MKRYSILWISTICIILYIILNPGENATPIEKIDIPSGISFDLINGNIDNGFHLSVSAYTFNKKDQISSIIIEGIGKDIPETRATRQQMSSKKFMVGLQKVLIYSNDFATAGINSSIDILFSNQDMNDMGWAVVFKGKGKDLLKYKIDEFPTSSDYINGMVESSKEQNFMSNNYKVMDMYVRVNSEGRSLVLPYLEILDGKVTITGLAAFKKDKMVKVIPMEEAKYLNILKENKVKGILTVQKDAEHWASSYGETKRKVSCEKVGGKYKFVINVEFQKGVVLNNTLYDDLITNPKTIKKYSNELEEQTKRRCNEFINKMKKEYKADFLDLGRIAAANFGRNNGTNWDDIVSNSEISVNVKVKIDKFGRGEFLIKNK